MNSSVEIPSSGRPITAIISDQISALDELDTILQDEERALRTRQPDLLLTIAGQKTSALARLQALETERQSVSAELHSTQLDVLRQTIARCKSRNAANANFLTTQKLHVDRLLQLLRGGTGQAAEYGENGKQAASVQRRITLGTA